MFANRATVGVLALATLAGPAVGQDEGASMMVLDGSGSMWGQIDATAKIEIARDAVGRMLAGWPEGRTLGLMAYGHRREGDCGDIETDPIQLLRTTGDPALFVGTLWSEQTVAEFDRIEIVKVK